MAKRKFFSFRSLYLPLGFLGGEINEVKNFSRTVGSTVKGMFVKDTPDRTETFDQAVERLGLTEADIQQTMHRYRNYAIFFLLMAIVLFIYAFYLLFTHLSISGCFISLAATTFCLLQVFRYDFWAYQMKVRRLGVSFKEWKQHILGGKGTSL